LAAIADRVSCLCEDRSASLVEHSFFGARGGACELDLGGVDVPLRDRCLAVAGLHLDVGEGVAGGGFVGEGGVAEVVEGPEWLRDGGGFECGFEVFAGEPCGVERRAFLRVGEDEVVVAVVGGCLPVLGEQLFGAVRGARLRVGVPRRAPCARLTAAERWR
jgi:hypothetical protein